MDPLKPTEIEAQRDLVERIVRRLASELDLSCDLNDLRGYGFQGVLEARERFDANRGVRFSTFAYYRVRGAVIDGVRKQGWLNRSAYAKLRALEATDDLAETTGAAHGPKPLVERRARAAAVDEVLSRVSAAYMLAAIGQDRVEDHRTPEAMFEDAQTQTSVQRALEKLPERERALLQGIYFEGVTIEQAGQRLGLSKSWASRLHAKALERMRRGLQTDLGA